MGSIRTVILNCRQFIFDISAELNDSTPHHRMGFNWYAHNIFSMSIHFSQWYKTFILLANYNTNVFILHYFINMNKTEQNKTTLLI